MASALVRARRGRTSRELELVRRNVTLSMGLGDTEMADMLLQVEALRSFYGKSQVLHGVSLDVPAGEITCLLGRNGVGKSTTLKSIAGVLPPSGGSVRFTQRDITHLLGQTYRDSKPAS